MTLSTVTEGGGRAATHNKVESYFSAVLNQEAFRTSGVKQGEESFMFGLALQNVCLKLLG